MFALSEGRRVARVAGATVFAIVMSERELAAPLVKRLGRAGADKVLLCEGPGLAAPPLDATHGPALLAAVERVAPLLILFPSGGAGLALGPSLAARVGAAYAGPADVETNDTSAPLAEGVGRVFLRRWRGGRAAYRRLDPVEIERPVIAILSAGSVTRDVGTEEIDVEVITCAAPKAIAVEELGSEPDAEADIALARVVVVVDPAFAPDAVARLAAAAPVDVAVVPSTRADAAIAAAVPEVLLAVGDVRIPMTGTPRGRVGAIIRGPGPAPEGTDVLWRLPPSDVGADPLEPVTAVLAAFGAKAGV